MLHFTTGDMFETPADMRVNTVNCVGVMGAGVALAFKTRYPEMFKEYKRACDEGQIQPGKLHIWKNLVGDWIINFPTKRHWKEKSRYEDIQAGLVALHDYLAQQGKVQIVLPALGCGHGGLDWNKVSKMIREQLEDLEAEIIIFEPADSRAAGNKVNVDVERRKAEQLKTQGIAMIALERAEGSRHLRSPQTDFVYVRGNGDLLRQTFISFASSYAPDGKEKDAILSCVQSLAGDGVVFSLNYDAALSIGLIEEAIKKGANVVVWVSEGLIDFKVPDYLTHLVENGRLTVASLAKPTQKWKRETFDRTQRLNLMSGSIGLITEPQPVWLHSDVDNFSKLVNKHWFYLKYHDSNEKTIDLFRRLAAKPILKNPETHKPNLSPILEIIHNTPDATIRGQPDFSINLSLEPRNENSVMREEPPTYFAPAPQPEKIKMTQYPKRLIEVDLPIKRISTHARREKSIRHGHISTLHIWWARRPLAACRAVICASLWPDPADANCPAAFIKVARMEMQKWTTHKRQSLLSPESRLNFEKLRQNPDISVNPVQLRTLLLDFIADFANWDSSTVPEFLDTSRTLTQAAHEALGGAPGTRPLVVDPFAGGGSIPLEALRVGADAFASDLNPVPVLLNKVVLEYIPKYGQRLSDEVRKCSEWMYVRLEGELNKFYPKSKEDDSVSAYLWARTILSEAPTGEDYPVEVPLFRSMLLLKKQGRYQALRWVRDINGVIETEIVTVTYADGRTLKVRRPMIEVFQPVSPAEVEKGTSASGAATCPLTGYTTSVESVRRQLLTRRGGAEDARMICVVASNRNGAGRIYLAPTGVDIKAAQLANEELKKQISKHDGDVSLVPDGQLNHLRGFFNVVLYGMATWGDLFSPRQALGLTTLVKLLQQVASGESDKKFKEAIQTCLALAIDRCADKCASLVVWDNTRDMATHVFGRQALPMIWDFAEVSFLSDNGWNGASEWVLRVIEAIAKANMLEGSTARASATNHPLPNDIVDAVISDPPYYAAIPYADLSDFFYSWLKRSIGHLHPDLFSTDLSPKDDECVSLSHRAAMYRHKDGVWFEQTMAKACAENRRITKPSGISVIVFANKETAGWEAMLGALISSGWVITGSWPIDTEMGNRLRAQNSAALASSVHLVCRPRENPDGSVRADEIGDWRDVLQALPIRIHEWMPRLADEGVVGADAIFACLGPALEIFSRYSRVEKASGETVTLKEYLEQVWAAVAKEALALVFKDADTSGFEADARLSAMWLWTLNAGNTDSTNSENAIEGDADDESENGGKKTKATGFVLEYDAARKIAQGLGANLEVLRTLVEISGDKARLLPVAERAQHLFGKDEGQVTTARKRKTPQLDLFKVLEQADDSGTTFGETKVEQHGETILDRIHQSMILFAAGRSEAMKRFLVEDGVGRDPRFWRLAQALSALYPSHTEEKRWVDGVLARKKGLGF